MVDNESQAKSAETAEEKRQHLVFDTWVGKWVIHRIPAAIAWYWFVLRFLNGLLPFNIQLEREYLLIPPLLAWLLIPLFGRWVRFLLYPLYVLFFPILIILFTFRLIVKAMSIPIQVTRFARSGRLISVLIVIVIAGWSTTMAASNPRVQAVASLSAHTATYLLFLQSFRWAANPYRPLTDFLQFCSDKVKTVTKRAFIEPALEKGGQSRETALSICDWILKAIDFLHPDEGPLGKGIVRFTRSHLVPVFIYGFVLVYVVLASSFSLSLYEVERAWGPQIKGLAESPSIAHYFYFSFLSQVTAVPDNIEPVSVFGQIWIVWIVMTGVLLLTVLITMFTTSVGVHAENALSDVEDSLQRERKRILEWKESLSRSEVETGDVIEGEFKQLESSSGE